MTIKCYIHFIVYIWEVKGWYFHYKIQADGNRKLDESYRDKIG